MADTTSAKGHSVKTVRGYTIMEWSGPGVESGNMKPFSVGPRGSLDKSWRGGSLEEAEAFIATAPALVVVSVTLEAYVPVASATEDEIEDWIKFGLHNNGSLSRSNPLVNHEFQAHEVYIGFAQAIQ